MRSIASHKKWCVSAAVAAALLLTDVSGQTIYVPNGTAGIGTSSTNNVGIGTSSPGFLEDIVDYSWGDAVELRLQNKNTSGGAGLIIDRNNSARAAQIQFSNSGTVDWFAGVLRRGGSPTGNFAISSNYDVAVGGAELLITRSPSMLLLPNGGNVGIGTPNPSMALDVQSAQSQVANIQFNDSTTSSAPNLLRLYHASSTQPGIPGAGSLGFGSQIEFLAPINSGSGVNDQAAIGAAYYGSNGNSSALYFQTENIGTLSTQLMIDPSGNIGVGTTSPAVALSIYRPATPSLSLRNAASSTFGLNLGIPSNGNAELWNYDSGFLRFGTSNAERVRIDATGNVGIGTTTPAYSLDVNGTLRSNDRVFIGPLSEQYPYERLDSFTHDGTGYFWGFGYQQSTNPANKKILAFFLGASRGLYSVDKLDVASWTGNEYNGAYPSFTTPVHLDATGSSYFNGGNVGFGTANPQARLDVAGNANISGALTVGGTFSAANYTASSGTITGGASGLTLNAGGTDQSITFSPTGAGIVRIGASSFWGAVPKLGVKTTAADYAAQFEGSTATGQSYGLRILGGTNSSDAAFVVGNAANTATYFAVRGDGNVGIGTSTPLVPFHVVTPATSGRQDLTNINIASPTMLRVTNPQFSTLASAGLVFRVFPDSDTRQGAGIVASGGANNGCTDLALFTATSTDATSSTFKANVFIQGSTGYVGVGTTIVDAPLTVKGKVHATEVVVDTTVAARDLRVKPTAWADDVFDEGYQNMPLSEVEREIKRHKHLPGVPSAQDVADNGVNLGQMQAVLLKKIEELTLHQIEQEKMISVQSAEIKELKQTVAELHAAVK